MNFVLLDNKTTVLSERDVEIVKLYSDGKRTAQIAKKLRLSTRSIESVVFKLRADFKCKTIPHLVGTFLREEIIK